MYHMLFHIFLNNQPYPEKGRWDVRAHISQFRQQRPLQREGKLLAGLTLLAIEATLPLYRCITAQQSR